MMLSQVWALVSVFAREQRHVHCTVRLQQRDDPPPPLLPVLAMPQLGQDNKK